MRRFPRGSWIFLTACVMALGAGYLTGFVYACLMGWV